MATLLDEVTAAFQEIGVLAEGEVPNAAQGADALRAVNRMIDQWKAEPLQVYIIVRTVWTIVSGTASYSVATSGTVNVARPVNAQQITAAYQNTAVSPTLEIPVPVLTEAEYQAIPQKTLTSTYPTAFYYDPVYPQALLKPFPIPTATTLQGVLYSPSPVGAFTALSDSVSLPPGYEEMLVTNLAIRLAAPYGRQVDPDLRERAREAKGIVKRSNTRLVDMVFPGDSLIGYGRGCYDIESDTYR